MWVHGINVSTSTEIFGMCCKCNEKNILKMFNVEIPITFRLRSFAMLAHRYSDIPIISCIVKTCI